MKIISTASEFLAWRNSQRSTLGFIPTLGALHDGHFSLIKNAKKTCELTVVSIFLNPTQFAPNEDLESYPNTLELDINSLKTLGVDVLFLPTKEEMYNTVESVNVPTSKLFNKLEGISRPHFFYGVTTIVAKLFNVINPTHAFFGQKDAQQLRIVQEMINSMNYSIKCIPCQTIRESNGLALSSRNHYLTPKQQNDASIIYRGLMQIKALLDNKEKDPEKLKLYFQNYITTTPKLKLDYISIACSKTLDEVQEITDKELLISVAVFFYNVRLIDNFTYPSSDT